MQIVVLGMHRSGTSSITHLLHHAGAYFGPEGISTGQSWENPKGFWERRDLRQACDLLLQESGYDWWKVKDFSIDSIPDPIKIEGEHRLSAIVSELDAHRPWVVKEPRLCLLMPLLAQHLSKTIAVVAIRHPWEVARSLKTRNDIPEDVGLALWTVYTLAALRNSEHFPRVLVDYNELIVDPNVTGRKMLEEVCRAAGETILDPEADVSDIIEPRLRRQTEFGMPPEAEKHPAIQLHRSITAYGFEAELPDVDEASLSALRVFESFGGLNALRTMAQNDANGRTLRELSQTIKANGKTTKKHLEDNSKETRHNFTKNSDRVLSELSHLRTRMDIVSANEKRLEKTEQALKAARKRLDETAALEKKIRRDLLSRTKELSIAVDQNEQYRKYTAQRSKIDDRLVQALQQRNSHIEAIHSSFTWRLSWPLRVLERSVAKRPALSSRKPKSVRIPRISVPKSRKRIDKPAIEHAPVKLRKEPEVVLSTDIRRTSTSRFNADLYLSLRNPKRAVVVPVYNAADELGPCLDALVAFTDPSVRLIVIDDASPDERIAGILKRYEHHPQFELYTNPENLGFTRTVNRGMALAGDADVVCLNSDTLVPPGWIDRLQVAVYSGARVATATPLSNNAGPFSAPVPGEANPLPAFDDPACLPRAIFQASGSAFPLTATAHGFCMYIRRDALDALGSLDEIAFPKGYGEENDFSMRALEAGWSHVADDRTLVWHARSASFGASKTALLADGRAIVDKRYPAYKTLSTYALNDDAFKSARERVGSAIERTKTESHIRPRALYVIATRTGGTPQTNQDLMHALQSQVETYVLQCDGKRIEFSRYTKDGENIIETVVLSKSLDPVTHASDSYDDNFFRILIEYGIELVHVRHIAWHSINLVELTKSLGIPLVFSLHDFYTVCPNVKLLDEDKKYCGGVCTEGSGDCKLDLWRIKERPKLKHAWVHHWQKRMAPLLEACDALVTTTDAARSVVRSRYPSLANKPFSVISHGRDFDRFEDLADKDYSADTKFRVLLPGNINQAKGADVIAEAASSAENTFVEFHILGKATTNLIDSPNVVYHGPYERSEFAARVRNIKPHIGGIFSIWPETYCHTLTELWSCGVPVIGFDIGAVGDRIRQSGAGWLVSEMTADAILGNLRAIASDPDAFTGKADAIAAWRSAEGARGTGDMAEDYLALYRAAGVRLSPGPHV